MATGYAGFGGNFDREAVAAEIRAAFDAYETALVTNDVEGLIGLFWEDPRAARLMAEGGHYGHAEIAAFRRARDPSDVARTLTRVQIVALTPDIGVANAEYRRTGSGRRGAQSHTWIRTAEGWRIAAAHVSLAPG
ncbi:MAG: AtzH-like domain-containing protein [Pseudomonadota bacterium]